MMDKYEALIQKAINCINENKFIAAEDYLKAAIIQNVSAPQTHNLFGILAEYKGDKLLAGKHYRAAYALDPTFKSAIRNLERITHFSSSLWDNKFDLGNKEFEEDNKYFIEYDEHKIGHLKRKTY